MAVISRSVRRPRLWIAIAAVLASPFVLIAAVCWWFTAPAGLGAEGGPSLTFVSDPPPEPAGGPTAEECDACPEPVEPALAEWPEERVEGEAAKRYLLGFLRESAERLEAIDGYTATMIRRERIDGELGPEQTLSIKVKHRPFAIYLRFQAPKAGKEAIFASGYFDDDVVAHNGDWTRRFIPRLKVDPDSPIALADNRHPITEAGLLNLTEKLLYFREIDIDDPDAVTILDRTTDEDGRLWYRSIHSHSHRDNIRPFAYVEVLYCPDRLIPLHIESYDWPEDGEDQGELPLAETYHYTDIDFDATLTAIDFDPSNPDYDFHRY